MLLKNTVRYTHMRVISKPPDQIRQTARNVGPVIKGNGNMTYLCGEMAASFFSSTPKCNAPPAVCAMQYWHPAARLATWAILEASIYLAFGVPNRSGHLRTLRWGNRPGDLCG